MEASAIPATVALKRTRIAIGVPLLRIRSDEQLVSLFRAGNDEAFRVIHDRYRHRLFVYSRQMLGGSGADAEDAVQEIFVRAYSGLRASDRQLALRAWLYRVAHNRCIDELRRPYPLATEAVEATEIGSAHDPVARVEQRDALRRLIDDVQRLPEQQRSALLMRELGGVAYSDISGALEVSVPAVKSLLVRARVGLAQASEARDTACAAIREDVILSHDRGVRTSGLARRHMKDCVSCREFRGEVRGVSRQLAALVPALGPVGVIAKLLGVGSGGGAAASSVTSGGAAAAGGAAGTGAAASVGALTGAGHVVTLLAAAVVTAGGAIELQHASPPAAHRAAHHRTVHTIFRDGDGDGDPAAPVNQPTTAPAVVSPAAPVSPGAVPVIRSSSSSVSSVHRARVLRAPVSQGPVPISQTVDPDNVSYNYENPAGAAGGAADPASAGAGPPSTTATGTAAPGTSSDTTSASPATGTTTDLAGAGGGTGTSGSSETPASAGATGTSSGTGTATSSNGSGGSTATRRSGPASSGGSSSSGKAAVFTVTSSN